MAEFTDMQHDSILPNTCSFTIKNLHVGIVNAVRRVILSELPNVAVSFDAYHDDKNDCTFHVNTCALHNEFLGHRISLIPIHLPDNVIDMYEPDMYRFVIDMQNTGTEVLLVTSEHIKVFDKDGRELEVEERNKMFPPDPITKDYILITKLRPNLYDTQHGERLHVEFKARSGTAKQNASWSPVSLCSYKFVTNVAEAEEALAEKLKNITDEEERTRATKIFETLECQRYYYKDDNGDPNQFIFSIESECALTPVYMFNKALDILVGKLNALISDPEKCSVHAINEEQNLYAITITNENHTIGNLLQVLIYENFIKQRKGVTFAGYNMPHPLESRIILKLRFDKNTDVDAFIKDVVANGSTLLQDVQARWAKFTSSAPSTVEPTAAPPKRRVISRKK